MYKAILTFSLLFLAVAGSAQSDGGADPSSQQPPSNFSSMTSQVYPSGTPMISIPPTASGGNYSYTKPKSGNCYQPYPAIPNVQPPSSSAVYSSAVPKPEYTNSTCQPDFESMAIPTGTVSIPSFAAAYPTTNVSKPMDNIGPNGTYSGNSTLVPPTPSSKPFASGPDEQNLPPISAATPTASYGKLF